MPAKPLPLRDFKRGDLALDLLDLALQLLRLILEEANGQRRLVFDHVAIHLQEALDEALQHFLGLLRIRIVEAHVESDDVALLGLDCPMSPWSAPTVVALRILSMTLDKGCDRRSDE